MIDLASVLSALIATSITAADDAPVLWTSHQACVE